MCICQIGFSQFSKKNITILSESELVKNLADNHYNWKTEVQEGNKKTADLNKESSWTKGLINAFAN